MKFLITFLLLLTLSSVDAQVTRLTGVVNDDTTIVSSKDFNSTMNLSYVANSSTIKEYKNGELVDELTVNSVQFFSDRIFYNVTNKNGFTFGVTYTFEDKTVFFGDIDGNFTEVYGGGLSFTHEY